MHFKIYSRLLETVLRRTKFSLISFSLVFLCSVSSYGQSNEEKISSLIDESERLMLKNHLEDAKATLQRSTKLALETEDVKSQIMCRAMESRIATAEFDYTKSNKILNKALKIKSEDSIKAKLYILKLRNSLRSGNYDGFEENLNVLEQHLEPKGKSQNNFLFEQLSAIFYAQENDYFQALEHFQKAEDIAADDPENQMSILHGLTSLYSELNDFEAAVKTSKKEYKLALKLKDFKWTLFGGYAFAESLYKADNKDEAKRIIYKTIDHSKKNGITIALGFAYNLIGNIYFDEQKLDSALYYFKKGSEISQKQKEKNELAQSHLGMARVYFLLNKDEEALKFAKLAEVESPLANTDIYLALAPLYARKNDFKEAYRLQMQATNEKNKEQNIESLYSSLNNLLQDKLQTQRVNDQEKNKRKNLYLLFGALLFISIASAIITFILRKNNKKLNALNTSLENKNNELKQFTYITSHDLKEPVLNIREFSKILKESTSDKNLNIDEKSMIDYIHGRSQLLNDIIKSLGIFTNIDSENLQTEDVSIKESYVEALSFLDDQNKDKKVDIEFENVSKSKSIKFSKSMLILLFKNLIQNAIKYNDSDQVVLKIKIEDFDNKTLFSIFDNGIGVDEEYSAYIFEPFKSVHSKSKTNSSGLGLAICKKIVNIYGGKIWVEPNTPKGSVFKFYI